MGERRIYFEFRVSHVLCLCGGTQVFAKMLNVPGLAGIIVFYLLILGIGVYAAWKRRNKGNMSEEVMLAGRSIGPLVGILTMTGEYMANVFSLPCSDKDTCPSKR